MIKIVDSKNLDDFIEEYGFKKAHRQGVDYNYYILYGDEEPENIEKFQQEFIVIHENLRILECYGIKILDFIYDMTNKNYLEIVEYDFSNEEIEEF